MAIDVKVTGLKEVRDFLIENKFVYTLRKKRRTVS